jgi:hypothetical protein
MPNNRKSAALALARKLRLHHGTFDQSVPSGLRGQPLLLKAGRASADQLDDAEQLKWEHMEHIANAAALLAWHCRLEQRREGNRAPAQPGPGRRGASCALSCLASPDNTPRPGFSVQTWAAATWLAAGFAASRKAGADDETVGGHVHKSGHQ